MTQTKTPLSVLDLVPIGEGFSISQAMQNSTKLAQAVENLGYSRYWVAEHHNFSSMGTNKNLYQSGHGFFNWA